MAKLRRILAICLVLALFVTIIPMQALAAEITETSTETTTEGGLTTEVVTTTTTTTDENGNPTVVVEVIESNTNGTTSEGVTVEREETTTTTTEVDEEGNTVSFKEVIDGSEKKEWEDKVTPEDKDLPEVTVTLKPGETVPGTANGTDTDTVDNVEGGSTATNSDKTTTITTTDRTVSATVSDITISEVAGEVNMNPVNPEDYEGKTNTSDTAGNGIFDPNRTGVKYIEIPLQDENGEAVVDENGNQVMVKVPHPDYWNENWDYQYFESGERSTSGSVYTRLLVFEKDADGNYIYDENGNMKYYWDWWTYGVDPHPNTAFSRTVGTYMNVMWDKDGNLAYTYCLDKNTNTSWGHGYVLENLDDCTYFPTEEAKDNIRAVVKNGYWGTEDGVGSLKEIKERATAWVNSDEEISFTVSGVTYTNTTEEGKAKLLAMIEAMNEGDAENSTQAAIWSHANGTSTNVQNSTGGKVFHGFNTSDYGAYYKNDPHPENGGAKARMWLAYYYLMGLEPEAADETTVLNKESFLAEDGLQLVVGDKITETEADELGVEHDVYNTDLSFTMLVVPSTENGDDLIVYLFDADGNVLRKARLAGDASSDDNTFSTIEKTGNTYTFKDLPLAENSDITFNLKLDGIQNLGEGVYVYKAVDTNGNTGYNKSQTMIGLSSGEQDVHISTSFTLNFTVDEQQNIVTERIWHSEYDPVFETPEEPPVEEEEPPVYRVNLTTDDGLVTIEEEPVPLAEAPKTGDNSALWLAVILCTALGIAAVNIFSKKRQHTTF